MRDIFERDFCNELIFNKNFDWFLKLLVRYVVKRHRYRYP